MEIRNVEKSFKEKLNSYKNRWDFDSRLLHLVEEVGELAEIVLQYKEIKEPKKDLEDIKIALADIIDDIYAMAVLSGISLDELTEEVLKKDK
ncbi:MAG: MazG-like family protein [Candidatus Zambryskibacteria bacterium]|nr:MazG-like family protein [Candidatus Zambryskibacteria bacterium]